MSKLGLALGTSALGLGSMLGLAGWQARRRNLDRWLIPYLADARRRRLPRRGEPVEMLLCIADHYEPMGGGATTTLGRRRVERWATEYPRRFDRFRDSDGRPPRHTFFYPAEEYDPGCLDTLVALCRDGYGEVEVHLHHDDDTSENLRATLLEFVRTLSERHGLLGRDRRTGRLRYGFVHGNWALDNSRPDGRWCGVNDELDILRETGCYADFTLPSAPSATQVGTINRIYYANDDPCRPRSHERGVEVGRGPQPPGSLMLIQGPLVLDWSKRRRGLVPSIENGCIQPSQPPRPDRVDAWLRASVRIPTRPDWFFVKLHTHGCEEPTPDMILGEPMERFHEALAGRARDEPNFRYHYVTAREMYNLARAAEAGWSGTVAEALDFELSAPGYRPDRLATEVSAAVR